MNNFNCITTAAEFKFIRTEIRRSGQKLVFTNGCFDLLHRGHIHLLQQARATGDILVVGMNSDASIREIKGSQRPIISQAERACILCALKSVDYVIIFDEPTPLKVIQEICPDILVKGSDWGASEIVGADFVQTHQGQVVRIPLLEGYSTSQIIDTICRKFQR
ncbi:D-glycero-beta-D-manno-heptose 1-phosphate adenylyltransferase [candidate division CSSED10-310 bacterium]|uniref:D-glycero-beta-D-manno-heptose 1-phosphate adenylyltransferase n=1 Tax=candidate division CSSED10-310 bacterium TaxID=2855610 RepID=A0ABV6Z0E6_UNCC1